MGLFLLWSARLLGAASSVFFLAFFAGEGIPAFLRGTPPPAELLLFLPLLLTAVAGFALALFAQPAGARMLVIGGAAMMIYHLLRGDPEIALVYGLPFVISGVLFISHRKLNGR